MKDKSTWHPTYTITPANANREIYQLLKNGVKVSFQDIAETVQVID